MNAGVLLKYFDRISEAPEAVPRLRRFVLDLAVRGKLVEQNPEDEPIGKLLECIEAETARLIRQGRIGKQALARVVENADQFHQLPRSWRWVRFGGIADFSAGRTPSRHDLSFWNTGDYRWASIADMKDGQDVVTTKETVSEKAKSRIFASDPEPAGTMIMSFKLTIGKISRLAIPAFHNEAIISIRPHLSALDPYLFKVLPLFSRMGDTKDAIKGATLNRESIANILLPLPPLAEQHRIVAKVDELMALCDRLEAAQKDRELRRDRLTASSIHHLTNGAAPDELHEHARFFINHLPRLTARPDQIKQIRQTILNLAVRGKLAPQEPTDEPAAALLGRIQLEGFSRGGNGKKATASPADSSIDGGESAFDVPRSWRWATLGGLAQSLRYGTSKKCSYDPVGVPVLRIPNVENGRINIDDLKFGQLPGREIEELRLRLGDILIVRSNGSLNLVGRPAVVEVHCVGFCYAGYLVRARMGTTNLNARYIALAMTSENVRNQIERPIRTTVGLKNINASELSTLRLPVPPLAEQGRIVARMDELIVLCDQLETRLARGQTEGGHLLEAILHEAIKGDSLRTRSSPSRRRTAAAV